MKFKQWIDTDERTNLVRKNILASFLVKFWSGGVFFLLVPLTLHCLGVYVNGIWLTISGALMWLDNMDIGLGNGLRNKLAICIAQGNIHQAREAISSTFVMLTIIIIPSILLLLLVINTFDLHAVMDSNRKVPELTMVMNITIIFVCSTFIFKFIGNFYQGLLLPAVSNLLITGGHTLVLIGTFILYKTDCHSLLAIAIVNTCAPLIIYLIAYPFTFYYKYKYLRPSLKLFRIDLVKELFLIGIKFFTLQMCGLLIMQSMNFLISKFFTPAMVTPYQIAYRYFSILLLIFSIITTPYWSATTDAWAKGDITWIKDAMKRTKKAFVIALLGLITMILFSSVFYRVWVGDMVNVPISITISVAIYIIIYIDIMVYSYFLNGIGALRMQLIVSIISSVVYIPTACLIATFSHHIVSIILFMSIINLPALILNRVQFRKIINGTAEGFWRK